MNQLRFFTLSTGRVEKGAGCAGQGTGTAHQGLPVSLAEAPAALPTSPPITVTFKSSLPATETPLVQALQKHSLYFE